MNRFPFSWALLGALAFAACAFPDIEFRTDDTSSSGAAPGTGGMGAGPTTGGMGTGATGGDGGQGGCTLGDDSSCSPDKKCTVVDTVTGQTGCGVAGDRPAWTKCFSDADCDHGLYCDGATQVCHPFCVNSGECTGNPAQCVPARSTPSTNIPNARVCAADCHPIELSPCDASFGAVTCYRTSGNYFDCAASGGVQKGFACNGSPDCAPGMLCAASGMDPAVCGSWCTPVSDFCGIGVCVGLTPEPIHQGIEYGYCDELL